MDTAKSKPIQVTVTFPLAEKPFHGNYEGKSTVGEVRAAAMKYFGAVDDPQHTYYLTHDGARQDDAATLDAVAGHARGLKFTLVKELIQG